MKIAIANDQHGYAYKQLIMKTFPEHEYVDCGSFDENPINYPPYGEAAARKVASGECDRAILICGTGLGMAITANKVKGCYATVCHDIYSAERSILSNNANALCMGGRVVGPGLGIKLADIFLSTEFEGGRHQRRVDKVMALENE